MIEAWPQKERLRPFSIFPELKFCELLTASTCWIWLVLCRISCAHQAPLWLAVSEFPGGGGAGRHGPQKPLSVGKSQETEWPFSPSHQRQTAHTGVCVCMFLGLCLCWPSVVCFMQARGRTWHIPGVPQGGAPGGISRGCQGCRDVARIARFPPEAGGGPEPGARRGGGSACQKAPGTDVRGTGHRCPPGVCGTAGGVGLLTFSVC